MSLSENQISVIIPVYNDEVNINHCLSALMKEIGQRPIEVIVVDDASGDNTANIVRQYNVTYHKNKTNMGQSKSRNTGAKLASMKYLLFIDSDVEVQSGCFDQIENFIARKKDEKLIGMVGIVSLNHPHPGWSSLIYTAYQYLYLRKPLYTVACNTTFLLIEAAAFNQLSGFDENLSFLEDVEFGTRLSYKNYFLQSGPVEIIHRKYVSWKWLFVSVFRGGQALRSLKKLLKNNNVSQGKKYKNNTMTQILFEGGLIFCFSMLAFLLAGPFTWQTIGAITLFVLIIFLKNFYFFFRVRRNPLLFIIGSIIIMLMPWIVVAGYFFDTSDNNVKQSWKNSRVKQN